MPRTKKPTPDQLNTEEGSDRLMPDLPFASSMGEVPDVFEMHTPPSYRILVKVLRVEDAPFVFVDDFAEPPLHGGIEDEHREQV